MCFLETLEEGWGFFTPLTKALQQEVCTQRSQADTIEVFVTKCLSF